MTDIRSDWLTRKAQEDARQFWHDVAAFALLPLLFAAAAVLLLYLGD